MAKVVDKYPDNISGVLCEALFSITAEVRGVNAEADEQGVVEADSIALGLGIKMKGPRTTVVAILAEAVRRKPDVKIILESALAFAKSNIPIDTIIETDLGAGCECEYCKKRRE